MIAVDEGTRLQIDRILGSESFRASETLRRLLKFLADKSLSGEADNLKEYSIGVDALGRPSTYDPRHDSTVRIHVGRLRQRLREYYQTEGKDDLTVIELPKGAFKLAFQDRPVTVFQEQVTPAHPPRRTHDWKREALWVGISMLMVAVTTWAAYATLALRAEKRETAVFRAQWTPELQTLWKPFIASDRPLLISISAPLFLDFPGHGAFRDASADRAEDLPRSKNAAALERFFNGAKPQPLIYFTTIGDANVTFSLGRLLASRKANVSMVNGNELSWRQISENNAIYVGSPKFFNQQLANMPVRTELYLEPRVGVHNLHPREHESATYLDEYIQNRVTGIAYTLVSHTPGPLGHGDVMSFAGRNGAGILGAVGWFTETGAARDLLNKIRKPSGEIPRYYQVLLKVRFQDGVPVETSYILHRELVF